MENGDQAVNINMHDKQALKGDMLKSKKQTN